MKSLEQQLTEASQRITALERENRSLRATLKTTDVAEHQVELVEAFKPSDWKASTSSTWCSATSVVLSVARRLRFSLSRAVILWLASVNCCSKLFICSFCPFRFVVLQEF